MTLHSALNPVEVPERSEVNRNTAVLVDVVKVAALLERGDRLRRRIEPVSAPNVQGRELKFANFVQVQPGRAKQRS